MRFCGCQSLSEGYRSIDSAGLSDSSHCEAASSMCRVIRCRTTYGFVADQLGSLCGPCRCQQVSSRRFSRRQFLGGIALMLRKCQKKVESDSEYFHILGLGQSSSRKTGTPCFLHLFCPCSKRRVTGFIHRRQEFP